MQWNEWRRVRNELRDRPAGSSTDIIDWLVLGNPGAVGCQPNYPFNTHPSPIDVGRALRPAASTPSESACEGLSLAGTPSPSQAGGSCQVTRCSASASLALNQPS